MKMRFVIELCNQIRFGNQCSKVTLEMKNQKSPTWATMEPLFIGWSNSEAINGYLIIRSPYVCYDI